MTVALLLLLRSRSRFGRWGEDTREDFVVYLQRGISPERADSLLVQRLLIHTPPGSSAYRHRDGVKALGYTCQPLEGHRAFTVRMAFGASNRERRVVDSLIRTSPATYLVLTDTECDQVAHIDATPLGRP